MHYIRSIAQEREQDDARQFCRIVDDHHVKQHANGVMYVETDGGKLGIQAKDLDRVSAVISAYKTEMKKWASFDVTAEIKKVEEDERARRAERRHPLDVGR